MVGVIVKEKAPGNGARRRKRQRKRNDNVGYHGGYVIFSAVVYSGTLSFVCLQIVKGLIIMIREYAFSALNHFVLTFLPQLDAFSCFRGLFCGHTTSRTLS